VTQAIQGFVRQKGQTPMYLQMLTGTAMSTEDFHQIWSKLSQLVTLNMLEKTDQ
jgi:hypothetical protein